MSSTFNISGAIKLGNLAAAPSPAQTGMLYYDTVLLGYYFYDGSQWVQVADMGQLAGAGGAEEIGIDPAGLNHVVATNVQGAIEDLDGAIGSLNPTPVNYTVVDAEVVASHLDGIDAALAGAGTTDFSDADFRISNDVDDTKKIAFDASALTAPKTVIISVPDAISVDLGDIATNSESIDDLVALSGVAGGSVDLGAFTGTTIPDDSTVKEALQALETAVEGFSVPVTSVNGQTGAVDLDTDDIDEGAGNLYFTDTRARTASVVDSTAGSQTDQAPSVNSIKQYVNDQISALPDPIVYQGTWDASTNTPELLNTDLGANGWLYRVTVAGTVNFGAGNISFSIGDSVVNNGTIWEKWDHSDQVDSVNGQTGAVSLGVSDLDDVNVTSPTEGQVLTWDDTNNEWIAATPAPGYSDEEAQDAVGSILDDGTIGDIDFTYDDATPAISAEIKNGSVVSDKLGAGLTLQGEVFRADNLLGGNAISEGYINSISLFGLSTNASVPGMAFDATGHEGIEVTYKIKEATTNAVRIGTIRVASNATDAVIVDTFAETASMPISFNVIQVGDIAQVRYTNSGSNDMVMRADIKRIM